jgi:hypothetical protein
LNEVEIELFQSSSEAETSLIAATERLTKIFEAKGKGLIQEHMSLSDALILTTSEQSQLDTNRKELIQQL